MKNLFIFLPFILLSCSRFSYEQAPSKKRIDQLKKLSMNSELIQKLPKAERHALLYTKAQALSKSGNRNVACQLFESLSNQEKFILEKLVKLRVLQNCFFSKAQLEKEIFYFDKYHLTPYNEEEFLRFAIANLDEDKVKEKDFLASLYYKSAAFENNLEAKIKVIQKAISLSQTKRSKGFYKSELLKIAPRFVTSPSNDLIISVARDLERAREFTKARELYESALKVNEIPFKDKLYALDRIALSFKVQRSREAYLAKLEETANYILKLSAKNDDDKALQNDAYIENKITQARAIWTAHQRSKGQRILEELLKREMKSDYKAQIFYILGAMALEADEKEKALELFENGLNWPTEDKKIKQLLSWSWANNLFMLKDYEKAIKAFKVGISKNLEDHDFSSRLMFWKAIAYENLSRQKEARALFQQIISDVPHSYYAILSTYKLGDKFRPIQAQTLSSEIDPLFQWLIALDERTPAKGHVKDLVQRGKLNPREEIYAYSAAGLHHEAIFSFARQSDEIPPKDEKEYFFYIYPKEYLDLYRDFGEKYVLPYELALSITRQESAFNPDARSWADAFGLMQLIPEKAEQLNRELNLNYTNYADLYNPELNIQLGSYLLAKLLKRYNSRFPFYIAAYNAGDGPVLNWQQNRFEGDVLHFVENIPYSETQKYVKLILRNMVIYRSLTSHEAFSLKDIGIFIE